MEKPEQWPKIKEIVGAATNKSSGNVSVYAINTNGTLTTGTAAVTGTAPTSIASTGTTPRWS